MGSTIKNCIQAVPIPVVTRSSDKLAWKLSPKEDFDLRSAYSLAKNHSELEPFHGAWICKLPLMPKIQLFLWKCLQNSIGVNVILARRGINANTNCPLCHDGLETIAHALRDCRVAKYVWYQLGVSNVNCDFYEQNLENWLSSNAKLGSTREVYGCPRHILFSFAIWAIWNQRNRFILSKKEMNPNLANSIIMQATEFIHCVCQSKGVSRMKSIQIRWEKPGLNWMKLNTDGAAHGSSGMAGSGGLIRDTNGKWITGYSRKLGSANSFVAEIWALRDGLLLCNHLKLNPVIVELDAKALVDAFINPLYANNFVSPLFEDCKMLAGQIPHICFKHVYREANTCADRLASLGCSQVLDFVMNCRPPVDLVLLVEADRQGLYYVRRYPELLVSW